MNPDGVMVYFLTWGQPCQTAFPDKESALKWLATCYDLGFLEPSEIRSHGETIMDEDQIKEAIGER